MGVFKVGDLLSESFEGKEGPWFICDFCLRGVDYINSLGACLRCCETIHLGESSMVRCFGCTTMVLVRQEDTIVNGDVRCEQCRNFMVCPRYYYMSEFLNADPTTRWLFFPESAYDQMGFEYEAESKSRRSIANDNFADGILPPSIMKLKRDARRARNEERQKRFDENSRIRTLSRRESRTLKDDFPDVYVPRSHQRREDDETSYHKYLDKKRREYVAESLSSVDVRSVLLNLSVGSKESIFAFLSSVLENNIVIKIRSLFSALGELICTDLAGICLDYALLFVNLALAKTNKQRLMIVALFARTNGAHIAGNLLMDAMNKWMPVGNELVAESLSDSLMTANTFLSTIYSADIVNTFINVILSAVSLRWFSRDFAKSIMKVLGKPRNMCMMEAISVIITGLATMIRACEQLYHGKPLAEVLFSSDPIAAVIREHKELSLYEGHLSTGLPVKGYMDRNDYRLKLQVLGEAVSTLLNTSSKFDPRLQSLRDLSLKIENQKLEVDRLVSTSKRIAPIGLMVAGDPEIGKSYITDLVLEVFSKVKGREHSDALKFVRQRTSQYFDGYIPYAHPYFFYSEIGNVSLEIAKKLGQPMLEEIQSIIDGQPFCCDMSAVEDKGKFFAVPEVVVIDTNNPGLWAKQTMYSEAAILRRFLHIQVSVKPEFRREGTTALDYEKSMKAGGNLLDRYNIQIFKYSASGRKTVPESIFTGDIVQMAKFLEQYFKCYLERSGAMLETDLNNFIYDDDKFNEKFEDKLDDKELEFQRDLVGESLIGNVMPAVSATAGTVGKVLLSGIGVIGWFIFLKFLNKMVTMYNRNTRWISILILYILYMLGLTSLFHLSLLFVLCMHAFENVFTTPVSFAFYSVFVLKPKLDNFRRDITMFYLVYVKQSMDQAISFSRNHKGLLASVSVCLLAIAGMLYAMRRRKDFEAEDSREEYKEISEIEAVVGASVSKIRVKGKDAAHWNEKISRKDLAKYKGDPLQMSEFLTKNIVRVEILRPDGTSTRTRLLGLSGRYGVINTHALHNAIGGTLRLFTHVLEGNDHVQYELNISERMLCEIKGRDLTVISLSASRRFSNIMQHINNEVQFPFVMDGAIRGLNVKVKYKSSSVVYDNNGVKTEISDYLDYCAPHKYGDCGFPMVAKCDRNGSLIIGMHSAGAKNADYCVATLLVCDELQNAINALEKVSVYCPLVAEGELNMELYEPSAKSVFRYEYLPQLQYYGRLDGPVMINKRSRLVPTPYGEEFKEMLVEEFKYEHKEDFGPPMMMPTFVDGAYVSPYNIGVNKMNVFVPPEDLEVVEQVINVYVEWIMQHLDDGDWAPFIFDIAINGAKGDDYFAKINMKASGGFGYPGPKSKYFPLVEYVEGEGDPECLECKRTMSEEMEHGVIKMIVNYIMGKSSVVVFIVNLKDEARLASKCKCGKTRLYYMTPADFLVVSRMFLGPLYSAVVENGEAFGSAVGINMRSGAPRFVSEMENFSEDGMEGDYGGFDVAMPLFIAHAANTVIYKVLERKGYNASALKVVAGILSDNAYPFLEMNKDIFVKPGLQPSGKYGTAEDNCIRNVVMMMYSWYKHPELRHLHFFTYVKPCTYGDDLTAAIKGQVSHIFNAEYYADACRRYFNMEFTAADKVGKITPLKKIKDLTFLKRSFAIHEDSQNYVARLELASIYKSLAWCIPSENVTEVEQAHATVVSALNEMFFWVNGEEQYIRIQSRCLELLVQAYGGDKLDYKLPGYREIYASVYGY
jgi:hypothetical protein